MTQHHRQKHVHKELREQSKMDTAIEKTLDPYGRQSSNWKIRRWNHQSLCRRSLWNGWKRIGTTCSDQTSEGLPSWFRRLGRCHHHWTEFVGHKTLKLDRVLKFVKKRPLGNWRRSQWNETRMKTFSVLPQCIRCTEVFWDR